MTNYEGVSHDARSHAEDLISAIARADAALDLEAFMATLAPDAVLRIGSQPETIGGDAIRIAIGGLFGAMRSGIEHHVFRVWGNRSALVYQAEATFSLKDGRDITLPYVNVLDIGADTRVARYAIAIDLAPVRGG